MKGTIILAHGSKRGETEEILNSLIEKVKAKTGQELVVPAYLQFSPKNLELGVDRLILRGAKSITIIPMFLFDGIHVTEDIPNEIKELKEKYPNTEIKMGRIIGDDDRVADIIADRMKEMV